MGLEEGRVLQSLTEVLQSRHILSLGVRGRVLVSAETQQALLCYPEIILHPVTLDRQSRWDKGSQGNDRKIVLGWSQ